MTNATLPAKASVLPTSIDVLFASFYMRYGRQWLDMWPTMTGVMETWAKELTGIHPKQMERALEHLGKFPPTLPEFKALCKQFRPGDGQVVLSIVDARREPMPDKVRAQIRGFVGRATAWVKP